MKWPLLATFVAGLLCVPGYAFAEDLGGTQWDSTNDCGLDAILFNDDGTAEVYDVYNADEDSATWTLDGNDLQVKFDTWYGGLNATVSEDRIQGSQTWQDDTTGKVEQSFCTFQPH